jgi:hypothetical protein
MSQNEFSRPARPRLAAIRYLAVNLRLIGGTVTKDYHIIGVDENGGEAEQLQGDLEPFLTAQQITTIETFMASLLTKAENALVEPA